MTDAFLFFCSWSGGKDSCLALHRMITAGHSCASLFTMIDETSTHSRSHGLSTSVLKIQAEALRLPIQIGKASWENYEAEFIRHAENFREKGIFHGAFGDIDLAKHREWVEKTCEKCRVSAHEPLWLEQRKSLVLEFVKAGYKAMIIVVNTNLMPKRFLGRLVNNELIEELESIGIDISGENGEYHTFVYDGPLFQCRLAIKSFQPKILYNYVFLPIHAELAEK